MKRFAIYTALFSLAIGACYADRVSVPIKTTPEKPDEPIYQRSPIDLPIEVVYDDASDLLEVFSPINIEGEVVLYDGYGEVIAESSSLNCTLTVSSIPPYSLVITGDGWIGMGTIE